MVIAWITEAFDHAITGFIGCYLFWVLGIVASRESSNFPVAFSGFADDTTWFLFGAILFGMMATKSGLADRIAYAIMSVVGDSYSRILLGLIISDFLLTLVVPSAISRIVVMAAVGMGLMNVFGLGKGSNVGRGIFIILTYCANIFDKMIIAGAPSILARGLIEKYGHVKVLYSHWLLAYLPCSILTILAAWLIALWLYPPEIDRLPGGVDFLRQRREAMGLLTRIEKKALVLMGFALVLWLTDFLHPLSPSMVGLGIGLVAVMPGIGILDIDDVKKVDFLPVFFVAAALSMGNVLVHTGALEMIKGVLFNWMGAHISGSYGSTLILYWTAFVYHLVLGSEIPMLSTSIPPLMQYALSHNLNPLAIGMAWTFAAGGKLFVYQSGAMIVGYAYGFFEPKDMFKVGLCLTIVESLILLFLVPHYWPLLGIPMTP
jgi:anion transporter